MIWISGNVTGTANIHLRDIKNATTIGSPLTITATAYEIKNELNESVNVTAELHVDGVCLNKNTTKIKGNEQMALSVFQPHGFQCQVVCISSLCMYMTGPIGLDRQMTPLQKWKCS
ncbi:MAG: hypothetical protein MW690_001014 [Methanophagales archaeon]|nr:hypothetical protein [Methanophagales archaeon]